MNLLRVEKVSKAYASRKVVDGMSLEVGRGEVVGLLGRNGAGKTTTFRMVIGLVRPNDGRIFFNEAEISSLPIYRRAQLGIGFLPQETSVFQRLTVWENLMAIAELSDKAPAQRKAQVKAMLDEYGLSALAEQKAYTLSGGEARRLEICRAMITQPEILLLDEPFSGVDPIAVSELQGFIRRLKDRRMGVLLTDHNVRETLAITDRSYIIDEGRLLACGTPQEIVENPEVRRRYLGTEFRL